MTVPMAAPPLRLMFWETTKACNLRCQHCRAVPEAERSRVELTTEESFGLIDQVAEVEVRRALRYARRLLHVVRNDDDGVVLAQLVNEILDLRRRDRIER